MVDMVSKKRYDCSVETLPEGTYGIVGTTKPPFFSKKILSGLKKNEKGRYEMRLGTIPSELVNDELEFNIYFIDDNYFCRNYHIYDLKSYPLEMLDAGMYMDSLVYINDIKVPSEVEGFKLKYKTLKFKIPFEKNKAEYSAADIKPVYDSLHLTDFNIKSINIKAYSSVEGSLKRNIELQEKRAQSIVNAMQEFQQPTIKTKISASENWVEFFNDIQNTKYANFADLNKTQIKAKLIGSTSAALEPYLKNHRKALITLELQKKDKYKTMKPEQLYGLFNKSVKEDNLEEAIILQNAIFERLKGNEISPDAIDQLRVPNERKYVDLSNNNAVLRTLINKSYVKITLDQLQKLDALVPNNKKIKYNIVAAKMQLWRFGHLEIADKKLKEEIYALENYGISRKLVNRMLINFHINKADQYMQKGDFKNKDKSMDYIFSKYKQATLTDSDYLNLANYFSAYSNTDLSYAILKDRVKAIDVDDDLLFYYINLTITRPDVTSKPEYRTMMLNAIGKDSERFCKLFNAFGNGGVTFQLLEDQYLRKTYCENCQN